MVFSDQKVWTLEDFQEFVARPENSDRLFELINGEIVEKMPGRTSNSFLAMKLDRKVFPFCVERNIPCFTSGGDGAYAIQGHVIAPDFAFKVTPMRNEYPDSEPPLWVVEIISPNDKAVDIRTKREIYLEADILYWEIYPDLQRIDVYAPGQPQRTIDIDGTLDGGDVLPDLKITAKELFTQSS